MTTSPAERDPQALTDAEQIREVLAEHETHHNHGGYRRCTCGEVFRVESTARQHLDERHRAHLAAVLADRLSARPAATTDLAAQALRDAADEMGAMAAPPPKSALALRAWLYDRADRLDHGTRTARRDTGHHGEGA